MHGTSVTITYRWNMARVYHRNNSIKTARVTKIYSPTNAHMPHRSYYAAITLTSSVRPPCIHIELSV